jgi:hypothetical protein
LQTKHSGIDLEEARSIFEMLDVNEIGIVHEQDFLGACVKSGSQDEPASVGKLYILFLGACVKSGSKDEPASVGKLYILETEHAVII